MCDIIVWFFSYFEFLNKKSSAPCHAELVSASRRTRSWNKFRMTNLMQEMTNTTVLNGSNETFLIRHFKARVFQWNQKSRQITRLFKLPESQKLSSPQGSLKKAVEQAKQKNLDLKSANGTRSSERGHLRRKRRGSKRRLIVRESWNKTRKQWTGTCLLLRFKKDIRTQKVYCATHYQYFLRYLSSRETPSYPQAPDLISQFLIFNFQTIYNPINFQFFKKYFYLKIMILRYWKIV